MPRKLRMDFVRHGFQAANRTNTYRPHAHEGPPLASPYFNILVRCSYRPLFFPRLIRSVFGQTYRHFGVIICYDDKRCMEYLQQYETHPQITISEAPQVCKAVPFFYNLHCNYLLKKVNRGWILFLDDDNQLMEKSALMQISQTLTSTDDFVIWKVKVGNDIVFPRRISNVQFRSIDSSSFCVHSSHKDKGTWVAKQGSDFKYISDLLHNYRKFRRKFIPSVLAGTIHWSVGSRGIYDGMPMADALQKLNVRQAHVSSSLSHFAKRFYQTHNLRPYDTPTQPAVFFGMYNDRDRVAVLRHGAATVVVPGGSDVPNVRPVQELVRGRAIWILSISGDVQTRLHKLGIQTMRVFLNMVDKTLFRPVPKADLGNKVFVYNGWQKDAPLNWKIYNGSIMSEVAARLPHVHFIYSQGLNVPHEKMPDIYRQCSIGVRLTSHDGNANTVQEFEAMQIPIIHNQSTYGLKWANADDVVKHVLAHLR